MGRYHPHIAYSKLLVFAIGCFVFVSSCKNAPGLNADDRRCKAFFEGQFQLYTGGEVADGKGILRNIDSFYSKSGTTSPLCRSLVYSSKSMDYYLSGVYDTGLMYADSNLNIIEQHRDLPELESGYVNALVAKARLLFATNLLRRPIITFSKHASSAKHLPIHAGGRSTTMAWLWCLTSRKNMQMQPNFLKQRSGIAAFAMHRHTCRCRRCLTI